ncbi:MAG: tryptophan 7-halogenase [Exilibacterium sp.]
MPEGNIVNIVILGGGSAGWMTAAALSQLLKKRNCHITLIESERIGTVGVGEATLPHLRFFNQRLGIAEAEFMHRTQATYKLGIEFVNWGGAQGQAYIHPFGDYGLRFNDISFHHYWLKLRRTGATAPIGDYSLPVVAAKLNRFQYPSTNSRSILSSYSYAYHVDASLYAQYLREYACARGVVHCIGEVTHVHQHPDNGFIETLTLNDGRNINGDLFIDCSGFRGLLIEQTLKAGYEDWSRYLPCDRAVAVPSPVLRQAPPYTRATTSLAGWRWRIPLRHRTGNGHVYCSAYLSDDEALQLLLTNLNGEAMAEPLFLRFNTGRRKSMWLKNCVAIGLSAGFLEPLESTGIHLIQLAIMKLIEYFPNSVMESAYSTEFNRSMNMEIERIKDFLVLHYYACEENCGVNTPNSHGSTLNPQTKESPFWQYCHNLTLEDRLRHKIDLFSATGHVVNYMEGLFLEPSWIAVYLGQGLLPHSYDSRLDCCNQAQLQAQMRALHQSIANAAASMPLHRQILLSETDEGHRHGE